MQVFTVIFTFLAVCHALQPILPEQLGETDWKIDSLAGTIENVVQMEQHMFVSTSKSEIARLNDHGDFDWFAKVSDREVSNLALHKRSLFSFSKQDNLVRMWNAVDGSLVWEVFLGFKAVGAELSSDASIAVDVANDMVTVLNDNCLFFVGFHGGLLWKWCATDAGELGDSNGDTTTQLMLSQLLAPSGGSAGATQKIAVGCVTGTGTEEGAGLCRNTIVLVIDHKNRQVFMDSFVAPGDSSAPVGLHGALQEKPSGASGYGDADIIFSAHSSGLDVVHLASDKSYSVPIPDSEGVLAEDVMSVKPFVLSQEQGGQEARKAAFSVCTASSCRVLVATITQGSAKIVSAVLCDATDAVVGARQHAMSSAVVGDVGCGHMSRSGSSTDLVLNTFLSHAVVKMKPSFSSSLSGGIVKMFPLRDGVSLVAASAGLVMAAGPAGIAWRKEDAISHITQVLVLDRAEAVAGTDEDCSASGNDAVPSLQERLRMQKEEALVAYQGLIQGLSHPDRFITAVSSTLAGVVAGMLPAPLSGLIRVPKGAVAPGSFVAGAKDAYFGFNKLAICLTLTPIAGSENLRKIRIVGIEFASRNVVWSFEPEMAAVDASSTYTALLRSDVKSAGSTDHFELLVSGPDGTRVFSVEAAVHADASVVDPISTKSRSLTQHMADGSRVISAMGAAVHSGLDHSKHFVLLLSDYSVLYYTPQHTVHALVKSGIAKSDTEVFSQLGSQYIHAWGTGDGSECTHDVHNNDGVLRIVRMDGSSCTLTDMTGVSTCRTEPVSSMNFEKEREAIHSVSHLSDDEAVHSRTIALGDDSLLLKALNPNNILVTSFSPAQAAEPYADLSYVSSSTTVSEVDGTKSTKRSLELIPSSLYVTLVDAVSGKVLHRSEIEGATAPVHAHLMENNIMVSYWNAIAKRTELVSMALYDGMVDKYALVPGANKPAITRANLNPDGSRSISAYQLTPPVVQSKTFILPRAVTGEHTYHLLLILTISITIFLPSLMHYIVCYAMLCYAV